MSIQQTDYGHIFEGIEIYHPLGRLLMAFDPQTRPNIRLPILPRREIVGPASIDYRDMEVRILTLARTQIVRYPMGQGGVREQEHAWSCPPDGVEDLHRLNPEVFLPLRPMAPRTQERWYDLQVQMTSGIFFGADIRRHAADRLIRELQDDPIERARAKRVLFADLYGGRPVSRTAAEAMAGGQTASGATTGRLTLEGLRNTMREMDATYLSAYPNLQHLGERLANDISRGVDPEREPRRTSQLRPIEEFLDGAEELIEEHRRRWLGNVDHLPDAHQGPAPVPNSCPEEHRLDHDEERPAPLAPPAAFLPGGRR